MMNVNSQNKNPRLLTLGLFCLTLASADASNRRRGHSSPSAAQHSEEQSDRRPRGELKKHLDSDEISLLKEIHGLQRDIHEAVINGEISKKRKKDRRENMRARVESFIEMSREERMALLEQVREVLEGALDQADVQSMVNQLQAQKSLLKQVPPPPGRGRRGPDSNNG